MSRRSARTWRQWIRTIAPKLTLTGSQRNSASFRGQCSPVVVSTYFSILIGLGTGSILYAYVGNYSQCHALAVFWFWHYYGWMADNTKRCCKSLTAKGGCWCWCWFAIFDSWGLSSISLRVILFYVYTTFPPIPHSSLRVSDTSPRPCPGVWSTSRPACMVVARRQVQEEVAAVSTWQSYSCENLKSKFYPDISVKEYMDAWMNEYCLSVIDC